MRVHVPGPFAHRGRPAGAVIVMAAMVPPLSCSPDGPSAEGRMGPPGRERG
jgi:hypothetical protein